MDLFDVEEFDSEHDRSRGEPDGCEICGHCRMLRELLLGSLRRQDAAGRAGGSSCLAASRGLTAGNGPSGENRR